MFSRKPAFSPILSKLSRAAKKHVSLGVAIGLLTGASDCYAAKKRFESDTVSLNTYYDFYTVLSNAPNVTAKPAPSVDVELTLRLQSVFSLVLAFSQFVEPDRKDDGQLQTFMRGAGGGLRVDFPGFFLLFADKKDAGRDGRLYPVNTYAFGQVVKIDSVDVATGEKSVLVTSRYGLGIDVFVFNPTTYIAVRYALFNHLGSMYGSPGVGLGLAF